MKIQEYDAFAIKNYSFALRKTNNFFSLVTVILSLSIIALSVMLNYSTVKHLWLPRAQLPILSSQTLAYPDPFSSTLLCFTSNSPNPKARILANNLTELTFPYLSQDQVEKQRPVLASSIGSQFFGCLDIKGIQFTQINSNFIVEVMSRQTNLLLESINQKGILQQKQSHFLEMVGSYPFTRARFIRIMSGIVTDSSQINSSPEIINTFYNDIEEQQSFNDLIINNPFTSNNTKFVIYLTIPNKTYSNPNFNFNKRQLSVTRFSIGYILGAVISWVSIFSLICSFVVSPLMDKYLSKIQINTLFHIKQQYSEISLIKLIVSSLKQGWFPKEDFFLRLNEKLQRLKDIAITLKMQKVLRRVCPSSQKDSEKEVIVSEYSFDQPYNQDFGVQTFIEKKKNQSHAFQDNIQDNCSTQGLMTKGRKIFLNWLDSGSDAITINYKGEGHGSKESVCISAVFAIGFLIFLSLFGVFKFSTTVNSYNVFSEGSFSYSFSYNQIVFASKEPSQVLVSLLDGHYNTISNISLISGDQCLKNLSQVQKDKITSYAPYYYCLGNSVTLVESSDNNQVVSLYVNNANFQLYSLGIFHFSQPSFSTYYKPIDRYVEIQPIFVGGYTYHHQSVLLTNINMPNQSATYAQFTPNKQVLNGLSLLLGLNIVLSSFQTTIQQTSTTIFDVMQNIWGFAVICFTVLLMKLTKYINIRQKERKVTPEKAEFRDSICILLSKINTLLTGRHYNELKSVKYYLKEPIAKQ